MKKILVPCDFSDSSIQALRFAIDIARQSNGEILLLNSIELPILYDTTLMPSLYFEEELLVDMKRNAESNFTKIRAKWAKDDPKVSSIAEFGPVTATISRVALERKADLIVMGTKGASGLREFLVGSNTEKIVRKSTVPVIAVKTYKKLSTIKNIVFPNLLGTDQEELTMKVKALQQFLNATLHIVYINTPAIFHQDVETKRELEAFAKRFLIKNYTLNVFNDLDRESGVINFTHQIGADMIAMSTHGRSGLNHLATGSIAENVVNHIDCPIWTYVQK